MQAEIVAVGTEITTGAKLDTNSQWLSTELSALGIEVGYHTSVADTLSAMVDVLRASVSRSELVLITGGLGPTLDDLTRQAMAELAGVALVRDEASLEHIRTMFRRRNRDMPPRNAIQADFPAGSEPIFNPIGTAPGIWQEIARDDGTLCRLAAFPGVPAEMKRMFHEQVVPRLPIGGKVIRRLCVNAFGIGESDCEQRLGELTARGRNPEVGITVHEATITLRINAVGQSIDECERLLAGARQDAEERLGTLIFSVGDEELEHVILRMLATTGQTLATVEAGTGGLLAHRLTDVAEGRKLYRGGIVVPGQGATGRLLGLADEIAGGVELASARFAERMAVHCRELFSTDFALAISECPDDDPARSEAPTAYVALAGTDLTRVLPHRLLGDTTLRKSRAAKTALNLLRLHLLKAEPSAF